MTSFAKRAIILLIILILFLFILALLFWFLPELLATFRGRTDKATPTPIVLGEVEKSIQQAITTQVEELPIFLMYDTQVDNLTLSPDRDWATARLTPRDPDTGEIIPAEPGLAIAIWDGENWQTVLPSDPEWTTALRDLPPDLLSEEEKDAWLEIAAEEQALIPTGPLGGYYLPWAGGDTMRLTQSVGHDRYTPSGSAHFAFDFATPGISRMYDVIAAKGGIVTRAVWHNPNGSEGNAKSNYLVLEDPTTNPPTYQLYLHLAQNSIPEELRSSGARVERAQLIGVADDTGVSSNHHLHFHVHVNPASYWGRSVDITFMEVSINGGRPRISSDLRYCLESDVCEETQKDYVSQNFYKPDNTPPVGGLLEPEHGITAHLSRLILKGWAADENSGIATAQFIAKYDGTWHPVGSSFTTNLFSMDWDMCADKVPDGPVSLAVEIVDKALNPAIGLPGLRHFTKNFTCPPPPPTCIPAADQVALFSEPDYNGDCIVLGIGSHTSLGDLGANNTVSIQVGANVQATLYMASNLKRRGETFTTDDSNLGDNRIGVKTTSSVLVQSVNKAPTSPNPIWPAEGAVFTPDASLSLAWDNTGNARQYQALLQSQTGNLVMDWQETPNWHLASLPPGNYSWQVKARNDAAESGWSNLRTFVVQPPPDTPASVAPATPPFTDTMETSGDNWTHSGTWDITTEENHTPGGTVSWKYDVGSDNGYDNGSPNGGYLTSQPIILPDQSENFLRFWYLYETEGPDLHWDQRWVQVSVDEGPFTNLLQLSEDVPNIWLRSPAIPLSPYAGHTIQIRFYFVTLDDAFNTFKGWYIDDFSVSGVAAPDCSDENNRPDQALPISYGTTLNGVICPSGDIDFYQFQGQAGDRIGATVDAQAIGSKLDSILFLLDNDGNSVLTENDDLVPTKITDSFLTYQLGRTGTYYLKVRSWDHPTSGSEAHTYTLSLIKDNDDPVALFVYPKEGLGIPDTPFNLIVLAGDGQSGVSHVEFLWHPSDWENGDWVTLGEDRDGNDGWNYPFNPSSISDRAGMAFYARVYDRVGNWMGTGVWNVKPVLLYFPFSPKGP